jgi:pimeloyl-ACP methyl ester carboxylesterase
MHKYKLINKQQWIKWVFLAITLALAHAISGCALQPANTLSSMQAEQFQIKSKDGKATLDGEINFRGDKLQSRPTIIMLHGTGPGQRDYVFQDAFAPASEFTVKHAAFLVLAEALTKDGYAVVRFDTRGVRCSQLNCPACKNAPQPERWGELCVNNDVRLTASLAATVDDIQSVYEHAITRPTVNKNALAFITHSAGGLHLGHLVQRGMIQPRLVIDLAGLAESPKEAIVWQNTIANIQNAKTCDLNFDGILTLAELSQCSISPMLKKTLSMVGVIADEPVDLAKLESVWLPQKILALAELRTIFANANNEARSQSGGVIVGAIVGPVSYHYDLSLDNTPVLERYADMHGRLIHYWGGKDVSVNMERQILATQSVTKRPKDMLVRQFPNLGHALGRDGLVGPMDDSVLPFLREDLRAAFR